MYLCAELENKLPAKVKLSGASGGKRPSFFQISPKESAQQMPFYLKTPSTAAASSLFPSRLIHCSMNDLLRLFIFAQTPLEELRAWLAATPHRFERFAPGERIIAQGAECRSALLLTAGKANTEMVQDGRYLSIDVLKAPMLLASAFLFGSENRMPVSVTAATECEVWTVNKEALFDFMLQHPEAMRRFVAEVSDRTQFLSRRLRQLTLQSLRCLLYTSDAADDGESVDLGGRRIIKKKKKKCFFFFSFFLSFFFFQAEDGIRDQPRSRGLGDVYKRQAWHWVLSALGPGSRACHSVSYTHLTLPTTERV